MNRGSGTFLILFAWLGLNLALAPNAFPAAVDLFKNPKLLKDSLDPFEDKYNVSAANPNLRDCFHSLSKRSITCSAVGLEQPYPQLQDRCSDSSHNCVAKDPVAGCYNLNFQRGGPIPGSGKCATTAFPFRVQVMYTTACRNGASSCHRESEISVSMKIFNDGLPNEPYNFDAINKRRDLVSSTVSGDPMRVACASLVDDGFRWNIKKNICERSLQAVCEDILGLQWVADTSMPEEGRCVSQNVDCKLAFGKKQPDICVASADYCVGYRYPSKSLGGIDCLCEGTNTDVDKNMRTCAAERSYSIYEDPGQSQSSPSSPGQGRARRRFSGSSPAP